MRVLPSIEKRDGYGACPSTVQFDYPIDLGPGEEAIKSASDTWIAFLCNPSPGDGDVPAVMDRSPMHKKRWPTTHPIVIWNGSVVSMEKSLRLSADPTPPGKEEDADVGLDKGWNTYKRYDRRDRSKKKKPTNCQKNQNIQKPYLGQMTAKQPKFSIFVKQKD